MLSVDIEENPLCCSCWNMHIRISSSFLPGDPDYMYKIRNIKKFWYKIISILIKIYNIEFSKLTRFLKLKFVID